MRRALGTTYNFSSSLPLLGQFSVDMPIAAMTGEAMQTVRSELRSMLPWILGGAVVSAFAGAALAMWIVPGKGRA